MRLTLAKEVLTELSGAELTAVVGAGTMPCPIETRICLTDPCISQPSDLGCGTSLSPEACGR